MSSTLGPATINDQHERLVVGNENQHPARPYFLYRQDFEDGASYEGISYGGSRFTQLSPSESANSQPAFSVHKTYDPPSITISVQSNTLAQVLDPFGFDLSRKCDVLPIFEHFTNNTQFMESTEGLNFQADSDWPQSTRELKLFVVDFLLDEAIFSDADRIRPGSVSPVVRQKMLQRKALLDLSAIEQAFDSTEKGFDLIDECLSGVLHEEKPGKNLEECDEATHHIQSSSTSPQDIILLDHDPNSARGDVWPVVDARAKVARVRRYLFGLIESIPEGCNEAKTRIQEIVAMISSPCAYHDSKGRPNINCTCDDSDKSYQATYRNAQQLAQRRQIFSGFRRHFRKSLQILEQQKTNDMGSHRGKPFSELSRFQLPRDPRSAWRGGIRVIRRLLQGKLPETGNQVILSVLTANVLRMEGSTYSCTQEVFLRDLHRWRDVISTTQDKHLFEEIVKVLLGQKLKKSPPFCRDDSLNYFQGLFQNLLSEAGSDELELDWHCGTRLSVIQARYTQGSKISADAQSAPNNAHHMNTAIHRSETYTGNWNPHDIGVIRLASTVVFCLVMALCLFLYHPSAHTKALLLMRTISCRGPEHPADLVSSYILVACYLGLSQYRIENTVVKSGLGKDVKCRCSGCGTFHTRGNISRHEKNCLKRDGEAYPCQICSKNIVRKDNHARHEQSCRNKLRTPSISGEFVSNGQISNPNAFYHNQDLLIPVQQPLATPQNAPYGCDSNRPDPRLLDPSIFSSALGYPSGTSSLLSEPSLTNVTNGAYSNNAQIQLEPGILELSDGTGVSLDLSETVPMPWQDDFTTDSSTIANATWSNLAVNTRPQIVPDAYNLYSTTGSSPHFADGILGQWQDNFAVYPSEMTNNTWPNTYASVQQQQLPLQFPIAPPQPDYDMNFWNENQYHSFVPEAPDPANMGPAFGLDQTYAGQSANGPDTLSYASTSAKRKTPSSPSDDYFTNVKRMKSGPGSNIPSMTSFDS